MCREVTIFFGVGAHAASASVVEFLTADGVTHVTGTSFTAGADYLRIRCGLTPSIGPVLGSASELDVGGLAWDVRLTEYLAKMMGGSALPSRAIYKLRKNAQQVPPCSLASEARGRDEAHDHKLHHLNG